MTIQLYKFSCPVIQQTITRHPIGQGNNNKRYLFLLIPCLTQGDHSIGVVSKGISSETNGDVLAYRMPLPV